MQELSLVDARRIALGAQGFAAKRPARPTVQHVRGVATRLHALQFDSVNVLTRAHYLPIYSRLGPYPMAALDRLTNDRHDLIEHRQGHQASFVPVELEPLLRWRLDEPRQQWRKAWRSSIDPGYLEAVEQQVIERGPIALSDLDDARRREKKKPSELAIRRRDGQPYAESSLRWGRPSDGKTVLDGLLAEGRLALAGRRGVERLYDLTERVIPSAVRDRPTPSAVDARRELVRLSAQALGVATVGDLANYFGLKIGETQTVVRDLLAEGSVEAISVAGWKGPTYLASVAPSPKPTAARALVGPFDSLTWSRDRAARLFGYEFSFEIYVPAPKRRYGYYVLPFLLDEAIVARVDLKADRADRALVVQGAYAEAGVTAKAVAAELAAELMDVASWLDLERVEVCDRGDLAPPLRRALPRA